MSRRKKPPNVARSSPSLPGQQVAEESRRGGPEPKPPKPNRIFLAAMTVVLVLWIVALVVLAATT